MAVDHNGDFADGWYQLGMTFVAVNKQKEAIDALNTFLKLAPDSPNAQTAKAIIDAFKKSK
jgi:cytochrome c-type biogenesis protein CcmH/NrfG